MGDREVASLSQGHTASRGQSPMLSDSDFMELFMTCKYFMEL